MENSNNDDLKKKNIEKIVQKIDNQLELQKDVFGKEANALKTSPENKIISIKYLKSLVLAGRIAVEGVAVVKQQEKSEESKYLVLDKDAKPIATIDGDFTIQIDPDYMKQYEEHIGVPGEQTESQKDTYDYDKQYKCEQIEEQENVKKKAIEDKKKKFSQMKQDIGADITAIVEIENKAELGAILDQDIPSNTRAYIVQFSDGATRICLEQGETVKEVATDVHTRQIEQALGEFLDMDRLDGAILRSKEFRATKNKGSGNQGIVISPESSGRDQVIESEGTTGRARTGIFVENPEGKKTQLTGSILYTDEIQTELDLQNYVSQETPLNNAIEAQIRLDLIKEAQRLRAEIESIQNSNMNLKDKHNMLNEKRAELNHVLEKLEMNYDDPDVDLETEQSGEDVPDTDDGDRDRITPEEEALKRNYLI